MKTLLISLSKPQWGNIEHSFINCEITTSQFENEILNFTASPNDIEEHGRIIFNRIINGEFGVISEFIKL